MTEKTCSVEGCLFPARAKGFCLKHYQNARRNNGKPVSGRPNSKSRQPKMCSAQGCDNFVYAKGYCRKHYNRQWRNGDIKLRRGGKSKTKSSEE